MELAVGASEASMKSLLGKLGGLLAQEYTLIRGVRGDMQYITDELASVQAFLGDLGVSSEDHDRRLKNWMKQIRDMAYDMEDCIDDFAHRLPHDSLSDARCSFILTIFYELWTFWPRREIASKIAELKLRAEQIAERRSRYGVDNPAKPKTTEEVEKANYTVTYYGNAEHLMANRQLIHTLNPIGVEKDMEKLGPWLTKESHRAVISIVGFGGVGKTTIATKLYVDFGNKFDCRASVTVSQNSDEDQVLRDILVQIKPRDREQEQRDHKTTERPAEAAGINPGPSVKRFVSLLSRQHVNNNKEVMTLDQEQQVRNTAGPPAEKNQAGMKGFVKGAMSLRSHKKQGNDGNTRWAQSKIETMAHDQLIQELQSRLKGKITLNHRFAFSSYCGMCVIYL